MSYPTNRKPKLSDPADAAWFAKTYLKKDLKGKLRRYLSGPCSVCNEEHEILWGNFLKTKYKFRHLKCAQSNCNGNRMQEAKDVSKEEIAGRVMRHYQHGARARGHVFDLSLDQFMYLCMCNCEYCGARPAMRRTEMRVERDRDVPKFLYNGIDRRDNGSGYTWANSAPCCTTCNFIKGATPYLEWVEFLRRVAGHHNG